MPLMAYFKVLRKCLKNVKNLNVDINLIQKVNEISNKNYQMPTKEDVMLNSELLFKMNGCNIATIYHYFFENVSKVESKFDDFESVYREVFVKQSLVDQNTFKLVRTTLIYMYRDVL